MLINMQLSHLLRVACLRLNLNWKPRSENDLADRLTNEDFSPFNSALRISFRYEELPLQLLNKLLETKAQFSSDREFHCTQTPAALPSRRLKTQW